MDEHSAFVGTLTGSPQYEVFLAQLVAPLAILTRNVAVPWLFMGRKFAEEGREYWLKLLIDVVLVVCPILLSQTLFAHSLLVFVLIQCVCIATFVFFSMCEYIMMAEERVSAKAIMNKIVDEYDSPTEFLTFFRSMMLIGTGVAILAVDFPAFPRRFAKTESYGHSLMDCGVAAFIFADGLSEPLKTATRREEGERRRMGVPRWRSLVSSSTLLLCALGLARTIVLTVLDYPQHVTEYGVHWNFFYTMAVVKTISRVLPARFPLAVAALFLAFHQAMLSGGYEEWMLSPLSSRDDLFSANREGLCSLPGYLGLFYLARWLGARIGTNGIRVRCWVEYAVRLLLLSLVFLGMQKAGEWAGERPSRRACNPVYVMAMMSVLSFTLGCMLAVQVVVMMAWAARLPHFTEESRLDRAQPCLLRSVNKNGIHFFLICNLATGAVNYLLDTHHTDDVRVSVGTLAVYMLVCCGAVHWWARSNKRREKGQ